MQLIQNQMSSMLAVTQWRRGTEVDVSRYEGSSEVILQTARPSTNKHWIQKLQTKKDLRSDCGALLVPELSHTHSLTHLLTHSFTHAAAIRRRDWRMAGQFNITWRHQMYVDTHRNHYFLSPVWLCSPIPSCSPLRHMLTATDFTQSLIDNLRMGGFRVKSSMPE